MLLEDGASPDTSPQDSSKTIIHNNIQNGKILDPYKVGEYVFGSNKRFTCKIKVINKHTYSRFYIWNRICTGESIIGRDGNQTGVVKDI